MSPPTEQSCQEFLTALALKVPKFVSGIQAKLVRSHNLDVSHYEVDHVCWRTKTMEEYSALVNTLKTAHDECELLIESNIGGRPIATFSLKRGIEFILNGNDKTNQSRIINVLEIPAPLSLIHI